MRLRRPTWLTASAAAFLLPALLIGFASVAMAAATTTLPGDPNKGGATFGASGCATCHGPNLGGGIGPPLAPIQKLGDTPTPLDPQYLIDTITNGKHGLAGFATAMPPRGGAPNLTDQGIKDIAAFIITQNQIPPGQRPLAPGDLAKSTITWVTIGILSMFALTYLLSQYNMRWIARKSGHR
jgi:mono/diheme cytochrome c family protein